MKHSWAFKMNCYGRLPLNQLIKIMKDDIDLDIRHFSVPTFPFITISFAGTLRG